MVDSSETVRQTAPAVHSQKVKVVGIGAGGHAKVIIDILSHSPRVQVVGLVALPRAASARRFGIVICATDQRTYAITDHGRHLKG